MLPSREFWTIGRRGFGLLGSDVVHSEETMARSVEPGSTFAVTVRTVLSEEIERTGFSISVRISFCTVSPFCCTSSVVTLKSLKFVLSASVQM